MLLAADATTIATLGGVMIGLAGVLVNGYVAWAGRNQAVEVAKSQQAHERKMAAGERLFERRAEVYERMIASVGELMEHVNAKFPTDGAKRPNLPEKPDLNEQRKMQARLNTLGSREAAAFLAQLLEAIDAFFTLADVVEDLQEEKEDTEDALRFMDNARNEARELTRRLYAVVSEELASL